MKKEDKEPTLTVTMLSQERELTLLGEPVLRYHLVTPQVEGTWKGVERIARYYRACAEAWKTRWERELYCRSCLDLAQRREKGLPFKVWRCELATHLALERENLLSLWQEGTEYWGFDRPLAVRSGEVWDLDSGAPRTLASFFPKRRGWRREVLHTLEEQAAQRLAGGESLLDGDCVSKLRRCFSPGNFWLEEDGVHVFFPLYALAPAGEGIPSFRVPLP